MAGAPETGTERCLSTVEKCKLSLLLKTHRSLSCAEKVGPLTIYRMALKHVKHQKMWEFETAKADKKNKVIMMVGETGSGKTSLINTMVNYIFGVDWKDDYRIQLIEESSEKSQAHSQTSSVTIYQINHDHYFRIPYTITIIDTPGFGDTKNVKHNEKIMRKMREFFHKCKFTEIDVICFVVPSTLARLTPTQKYIYDNILSIFGNDIKENIVFFTTFADVQEPSVLSAITETGVLCANSEDGEPVYFKVNNSMVYAKNGPDEVDDYVYKTSEGQWKMGMESTRKFLLHFLPGITSKDFSSTKDVLAERNALEVTLDGLVQKIEEVIRKHHELEQTERALNKHKAEIEENEHFEFEVLKTAKRKINSFVYSTNCQECHFTCHQDCLVYFDPSVCSCEVFSLKGTCSVCGHSFSKHVSENVYWQTFVEPKKKSYFAVKEKYEKEENKVMTPPNVFIKLKDDLNKSEAEVLKLIQEIAKILKSLKEITLKPNLTSAVDYIRLVIEKENKEGTSGFIERIQILEEAIKRFENQSQRAGTERHPTMVEDSRKSLPPNLVNCTSSTSKAGPLTIYGMSLERVKAKRKNKVIMMVGETGSGKTTLINAMINYIFGVEWRDDHRFHLTVAHNQTSNVSIHQINHEDGLRIPYSLTLIDTLGFGDTRGIEHDEKIMRKIREFFYKCKFTEIDAICFVVRSSLTRLTPAQAYIFDNILSIFGKDIKDNIVFFTTFADDQKPSVLSAITKAEIPCALSKDGLPVHFKVNNCMLYANNRPDEVDAQVYEAYERQWKMGMKSIEQFLLNFLPGKASKNLRSTRNVLAERNALEVTLDGLVQKLEELMFKQHELQQTERALNEHKTEIKKNEHFEFELWGTVKIKKHSTESSTNCHKCKSTCHQDCLVYFDTFVYFCEAFNLIGTCRVCGHGSSTHFSETFYWQTITQPKKITFFSLKKRYEEEEKKVMTLENVLKKLKSEIRKAEDEALKLIQEVARILEHLQKIALKPDPVPAVDYIRRLIEKEKREGKSGFMERIELLEEAITNFVPISNIKSQGAGASSGNRISAGMSPAGQPRF
ncbi:uncharacterized protein LOC143997780 [Lithobates pipiens]